MKSKKRSGENEGKSKNPPDYPLYPSNEDIYNEEEKKPIKDESIEMGNGLDVPGQELDDANEKIGEEDEENNYYSLGGDKND
jgi:hypothetical protein